MPLPKPRKRPAKGTVFLVRGEYAEKRVWHYLMVDGLKLALFKEKLSKGTLDVAQFGTVLYSGWGDTPPADIKQAVEAHYG